MADYAVRKGVTTVKHTFTSHLALCASIQLFAGLPDQRICEYPVKPQPMACEMCKTHIAPDANGEMRVPEAPGLGIEMDRMAMKKYLVGVEITVGGKVFLSDAVTRLKTSSGAATEITHAAGRGRAR